MSARVKGGLIVVAVGGVLVGCVMVSSALAVLYAYEGFDYAPGELLGQDGGNGFSGAWTALQTQPGRSNVVSGGFTYQDTNGNQLAVTGNHVISSGETGNASPIRDLNVASPINSGTLWWSFIGQRLQPHATEVENTARASSVQLHNSVAGPLERLAAGKGTSTAFNTWGLLHSGNVANQVNSTVSILEQAFVVVRVDYVGDGSVPDDAYLFINPLLDEEPQIANAAAQFIGQLDFSTNRIRTFTGNTSGANPYAQFAYDEIRLGTTYADVAPIAGAGLVGDYNNNGVVDAADYTVWRNNLNAPSNALMNRDPNNSGNINADDYASWKANFGASGAGGGALQSTPVPEPATALLCLMGIVVLSGIRRR